MGCFAILAIPSAGISFFFSSWVVTVFWRIMADAVEVGTISYKGAMVVTMAPLIAAIGLRRWRQ
ncbi:MAG: hypothetical protein QGI09_01570 [Dehalococcoidia bacterium]|jgi:hypothetical protein|nr:hypothetical protein [Dehalococcoidia bacterium]